MNKLSAFSALIISLALAAGCGEGSTSPATHSSGVALTGPTFCAVHVTEGNASVVFKGAGAQRECGPFLKWQASGGSFWTSAGSAQHGDLICRLTPDIPTALTLTVFDSGSKPGDRYLGEEVCAHYTMYGWRQY